MNALIREHPWLDALGPLGLQVNVLIREHA
jgi:hypothetical protein